MKIFEWHREDWDIFVDKSPQGTIFNKSCFLESYNQPVRYLKCTSGDQDLAGFAFVETPEGIKSMPYQTFNGIIFRDLSDLKQYRRNETIFSVLQSFAEYLFHCYREVEFENHWDIIDMRPFDWLNYHEREKGYYRVIIRYTSHRDISMPDNTAGYARIRKRDLKKCIESTNCKTKESDDIELLNRFHDMTFDRQGIKKTEAQTKALINICKNLIHAKAGKLLVTNVNEEPAIASFFIYDRLRAYHLFVGTNLRFRDLGVGTKNLYDSCCYLNDALNIKELDMVGINSPLRGGYKLTYGGKIVPYYGIKKVLPRTID